MIFYKQKAPCGRIDRRTALFLFFNRGFCLRPGIRPILFGNDFNGTEIVISDNIYPRILRILRHGNIN